MEKYRPLSIGGKWVEPVSQKRGDVINPSNGEVIAEYAIGGPEDVDKAVAAAKKAFDEDWYDTTPQERATVMLAIADMLDENADEFARLETLQAGKPLEASVEEISIVADVYRYYAGLARTGEGLAAQEFEKGFTSIIRREPLGVTAGICPWNYPFGMMSWKTAPALAAGNTSVIKPASITPLTSLLFAEKIKGIVPDGVINVVTGSGTVIGDAICAHPDVTLVSLTGDTSTGRYIAKQCAGTLKRVHLELGGKAPVIAFDDCDIEGLIETVGIFMFWNAGQNCGQPCRFIIQEGIYDQVVTRLIEYAESIKVGDAMAAGTELGPVISAKHLEEIAGMVDRAVAVGAKVKTGGKIIENGGGFYYAPTILAVEDQKAEIIQKEVFGPVVTIQKFTTEEEALHMANDVIYGLASSVWTSDAKRTMRMSRAMQFGTVWVNAYEITTNERPWGGYKQSGYGKDLSKYSLEDYTQIKNVVVAFE